MASISGTTKIGGVATQTLVSIHTASDMALVELQETDLGGAYDFTGLDLATEYIVVYRQKVGSVWEPSTAYLAGDVVRSTDPNGFWYLVTQAGTSGASEPVWPLISNEIVADGTCFVKNAGFTVRPTCRGPLFPI